MFQLIDGVMHSMQVNTHGTISFQSQYLDYTPDPLPFSSSPLILLFWADTDIRRGGSIHYRETNDTDLFSSALQLIPSEQRSGFRPTSAFIATWNQVPQTYSTANETNTYQAVLMTDGSTSFVCFLYKKIEWSIGVDFHVTPAQIGFNAGDGNRSFTVPGGLTPATYYMGKMSNVGRPGLFVYQVDGEFTPICVKHD